MTTLQRAAAQFSLLSGLLAVGTAGALADVQLDEVNMADGFNIEVWAEVEGARSMALGDDFVVVGTRNDAVHVVKFDPSSYQAGEVKLIAEDLSVPNGVTLVDGVLYIALQPHVVRWGDAPLTQTLPCLNLSRSARICRTNGTMAGVM